MGNLLGSPVTEKETHVGQTPDGSIQYGVSSMQGWRIHMEDAHIAEPELYALSPTNVKLPLPGHSLFAVFDGHGGTYAAEYAGLNFCHVLSRQPKFVQYAKFCKERKAKEKSLSHDPSKQSQYIRSGLEMLEAALREAFVDIDRDMLRTVKGQNVASTTPYIPYNKKKSFTKSKTAPQTPKALPAPNSDEDAGTTAIVVMVTPTWIVCANAGDSRAVSSKQGHRAVPLSYDHKPDDEEEERRIRAAGGYVAGGRVEGDLAVSRGLGDFRFKMAWNDAAAQTTGTADADESMENSNMLPEDQKVSPVPDIIVQNRSAEQDEFIIVACDGIWDVQTNYECVKMVADIFEEGEKDLGLLCEEMLDMCLSMGSKDNMTALVIKFPAQKIGNGGGVLARREKRDADVRGGTVGEEPQDDDDEVEHLT